MTLLELLILCAYVLTFFSIIAVVFLERKDPTTTLTWMLLLSLLPVIGVILYIFLGRGLRFITRRKMRIRAEIRERYKMLPEHTLAMVRDMADIMEGKEYAFSDPSGEKHRQNIAMNAAYADAAYTQDNTLKIYTDTREHYDEMFREISEAKQSVNIMYFIIANDDTGREFIEILTRKAREGVNVRLIYDELGSITTPNYIFRGLKKAGGEVYRFFPLFLGGVLRANYRNHHKIVVIDGKIAYMGGMNIGNNYLGLHKRITPWRDTHMRFVGGAVNALQIHFYLDLYYATDDEKKLVALLEDYHPPKDCSDECIGVQIVSSGPDDSNEAIKRGMIDLISSAKKNVLIQSPYLMPDVPMLEALQNAAKRGVQVRFMLPGVPDKRTVYTVTNSYIGALLDYGVEVYKHKGFLHAKMLVVDDDVASLGTCNMDMRSFALHFEVNAFVYHTATARQCSAIFQKDLENCVQVTQEVYKKRSLWQKFRESLLRLLAPLM